jgi:hypothetical protein
LGVDVEGVFDWAPDAMSAGAPGSPATPAADEVVPVAPLAVVGEEAVAMPTALPPARAPATIVAPSSLEMFTAINLLGLNGCFQGILRRVAKRICRGA